jgi:hypothetical protein
MSSGEFVWKAPFRKNPLVLQEMTNGRVSGAVVGLAWQRSVIAVLSLRIRAGQWAVYGGHEGESTIPPQRQITWPVT